MKSTPEVLRSEPPAHTADSGPRCRGGRIFLVLVLSLVLLVLGLWLALARDGQSGPAATFKVLFIFLSAAVIWGLAHRLRHCGKLPRSHAVLAEHLAFRIDYTCRDVALAVFFEPDTLAQGAATRLLCFLENQSSRQRVAELVIGPHVGLGLSEARRVALHLAAGQAAVYVQPLVVASTLSVGEHDLPVSMCMSCPTGTGLPLPGARRHLHNLHHVHFAAPFTVVQIDSKNAQSVSAVPLVAAAGVSAPLFITLASVDEKQPELARLEAALAKASE